MAIHFVRYRLGEAAPTFGLIRGDRITPIPGDYPTTRSFLAEGVARGREMGSSLGSLRLDEVSLESPVTVPCQVVAQGVNYRSHLLETGRDPNAHTFNMLFRKAAASIVPADHDILRPPHVRLLDYEIELGIVIGRRLERPTRIDEGNLHEYVGGIVIANDVSARDVQVPQMQFYKGKSYRTFCPVGPYLCVLDREEMPLLQMLAMRLEVNGEVRQKASTGEMIHRPAETLSEISALEILEPGDLLLTGTPAGVALKAPPPAVQKIGALLPEKKRWEMFIERQSKSPRYLRAGDRMTATIHSLDGSIDLGIQRNTVRDA